MKLENYITLVLSIPLASLYLSTILIHRIAFLVFLSLCYIPEILGGLFQISIISQIPFILSSFSLIEESNILFSIFVPIMIYNAEIDKAKILSDNKGKTGIYLWRHNESGKIYIGSALDLNKRLRNYCSKSYLNRHKCMHIYNALLFHGYSTFSLNIIE
jgi:hypothetical protein